jgi:putative ABC transport system permease protein
MQTGFVQKTNLGYNRENLIYLPIEGDINPKYSVFKERLLQMPGISMVDRSTEAPHAMGFIIGDPFKWEGQKKDEVVFMKPLSVGFDFLKIMDMKIVEGRDFKDTPADSADAFMVNEEAVRQMGLKDPIGKEISAWAKKGHIVAVLKDYHTHSLREPIKPVILDVKEYEYFGVIIVRTEPGKTEEALASLEKMWKEFNPNYPFEYQFVDKEYEKLYRGEMVVAKLTNVFAVIAISISCLGLLGLMMFSAEQRTKEIGIRKVLGATVSNIISLLSKDFLKLVAISFLIAAPVAGFFMNKWLESFAFRTPLSWWIFAVAGISALVLALLTISVQAFTAAIASPVKSLKAE